MNAAAVQPMPVRPSFMKMITVNSSPTSQTHQQQAQQAALQPVLLNAAFRPQQQQQQGNSTQSVIIHNSNLGAGNGAGRAQHVIIDPRTMNVIQTSGPMQQQGATARPVQYRLVQSRPQATVVTSTAGGVVSGTAVRFQRPQLVAQQQQQGPRTVSVNRTPSQVTRPQFKVIRGPMRSSTPPVSTVRYVKPTTTTGANLVTTTAPTGGGQMRPRMGLSGQSAIPKLMNIVRPMQQRPVIRPTLNAPGSVGGVTRMRQTASQVVRPSAGVSVFAAAPPPLPPPPPPPPMLMKPMVEVRLPNAGNTSRLDDDIENSLSTAILHRAVPPPPPPPVQQQQTMRVNVPNEMGQ